MKKTLFIIMAVLLFSAIASAEQSQEEYTSGLLSSSALIVGKTARLTDISAFTDGINNVTILCYDNTSGSGTILEKLIVPAASYSGGVIITVPKRAATGIYCTLTTIGTGGMIISYDPVH